MTTIVLRSIKGIPLTNAEVDANFSNLNTDKLEISDAVSTNTVNKVVKRDVSGNFSAGTITASLSGTASQATNIAGGAIGSIPYQTNANTTSYLTIGTSGQVLTSNGIAPVWTTLPQQATITDDTSTDATRYIMFGSATSGSLTGITVSSTKLYYNPATGSLNATNFNSLSDASLKTNIKVVENALGIVSKIDGVEFDWVETGNKSAGVIADALESVLPHLVETNSDGIKSVNYPGLTAYLIQSIKELNHKIETIENNK